jgi:ribose transport system permease protein
MTSQPKIAESKSMPQPDEVTDLPDRGPQNTPARRRTPRHIARELLSRGSLVGIWGVMVLVFGLTLGGTFLQAGTFQTIFSSPVELIFLSLALVITFSVGEFDLSVAALMGIAGTILALLTVQHGFNPWLAGGIAVAVAGAVGLLNGFLVVVLGVNAIVVTLGVGTALVGVALWLTKLNTINGLPASFSDAAIHRIGGVSVSFFYGVALTLLLAYVMTSTPLGLRMSFVGANREVARLAGVRVNRIRLGSYVASGIISGLGGVVLAATLGGYDPALSPNYLLPAFAAVFLGTAAIQPGAFNAIGAFIGIFFLQTGIVGLQLGGLTGFIEDLFYGGTLVIAVTISTIVRRRTNG